MGAMTALLLAAIPTSVALAGDDETLETSHDHASIALNTQGLELYAAGKYHEAVEAFLGAFALGKDPNTLFNVARCYELLGEWAAALDKYESFLSAPDIEPEGRARAVHAVQSLRQRLESSRSAPRTEPEKGLDPNSSAGAEHDEHVTSRRNRKVLIGWTATGALAAGAAVGGILALTSARDLEQARNRYPASRSDIDGKLQRTTRCAIATDVLGAAAAAAGALSLYWTIMSWRSRSKLNVAIGPAQFRLRGSF
jgi:tetratricopeptide (TPR) repeat protein